jgi:ABC-type polysaccharide/polyol phosphate export permease
MLAVRDMKVKYKQAALGPLWLVIAPLGMLAAVTIAFSGVTDVHTSGIPYVPFALCGLTVWSFIQLSLTMGTQAILANGPLVRRSPLPRVALMTGSLVGNTPPLAVLLVATLIATLALWHVPAQVILVPLLILWVFVFTLGVTLLVSAVAARFRDTVSLMPLIIQAGIFVSPVGYGLEGAPKNIQALLILNPVSGLIEAFRWAVLGLPDPNMTAIAFAAGWTLVGAVAGWWIFGRMEVEFADYV